MSNICQQKKPFICHGFSRHKLLNIKKRSSFPSTFQSENLREDAVHHYHQSKLNQEKSFKVEYDRQSTSYLHYT